MHSFTRALTRTHAQDPETLRKAIRDTAASLLAIGLDPARCVLFQQSRVLQHTELAWLLGCVATTGQLETMTQWKASVPSRLSALSFALASFHRG